MAELEQRILLADADVLIDYVASEKILLRAISDHIAPLAVLEQVLDTVDGLNRTDGKRLHIDVVETTTDELLEAGQSRGALSFDDRLNLHACIAREWICVSNDVLLLKACAQKNVPTKRGLRLLFELAEASAITTAKARRVAQKMHESNPHHINERILARLAELLDSI